MNKGLKKILGILGIFSIVLFSNTSGFAEDITENNSLISENTIQDFEDEIIEISISEEEILLKNTIEDQFRFSKTNLRQIQNSLQDKEYHLSKIVETKNDLESQLKILNEIIKNTEERLNTALKSSVETENEIKLLNEKIEILEIALEYQKQLLKDYIEILYKENKKFFPYSENGEVSTLRLLLADNSVGDNLKNIQYINLLNQTAYYILDKLNEISFDLEAKKIDYNNKTDLLNELLVSINFEKENLEEEKNAKVSFLKLTKGQEEIYSQLIEQSKIEQNEAIDTVRVFNIAVKEINSEIEKNGSFDVNKYQNLLGMSFSSISEYRKNFILNGGEVGFDWPIEPTRGISAYFRDPGYAGVFGVRHNAIDIPAYQGSPVRSAGDGVVYKAVDNGYGYSYIIIAHADGFSTVYGHISKILVQPSELVSMGSIIGLSGGMPGTKGAGYMTTGPHLHFEMLKDSEFVDPLLYLPLYVLTEKQMDWLPERFKELWRLSVLEKAGGKISRNDEF